MTNYLIIGIVAIIALLMVFMYNKFVRLKNQVEEAWSGIDVQLKRRYDLIPNLVQTVKTYAIHEKDTFESIVHLRNAAQKVPDGQVSRQANAENMLATALGNINILAENYPDLKANTNYVELQKSLAEVEDNLQQARRYYNATVRDNNIYVESFPSMIVAKIGGFHDNEFFEIESGQKQNIKLEF